MIYVQVQDQQLYILKKNIFYKTIYLSEEINCTKPSASVRVPCYRPDS